MYTWLLGLLWCSGYLTCTYLATAKAGGQACCMDFKRDFKSLPHGQDGLSCFWFVSLAPFPEMAPALLSCVLADTLVCNPEQNPFPSVQSLSSGWFGSYTTARRGLEKYSALSMTQEKHEDAFEERKNPAGHQMEQQKKENKQKLERLPSAVLA